jgi:Zn-dependent peptidase ImmA (M78 family)/transcriptional regulator with XRE-family HTH domain
MCRAIWQTAAMGSEPQLGDRLRESRTNRGLSLRAVERESGINSGYLSQLERNEIANPTPSVLHRVAKAYGEPFGVLMQWAGYVEDDPKGVSPNAKRALDALGTDFTDQELQAMRAVLDAIRASNRAGFEPRHRTDIVLTEHERANLRAHALAVLRETGALESDKRVNIDDVLLVAKLVRAGAIELTLEEKKRLHTRFRDLVDRALNALQGVVHLDRGEIYLNPDLDHYEQRKRFVLGHEIAHAVLEDHRLTFAHLDDNNRLNPDFADFLERQANQFSIELLAKGDRLRAEFDDSPPKIDEIERLAKNFGISLQAAARRLAEESHHACAVAMAWRSQNGQGSLFVDRYKLWCSASFDERLGWRTRKAPHDEIRTALRLAAARAVSEPLSQIDRDGRTAEVSIEGKDAHFMAFTLFSCPSRPRLRLRRAVVSPLSNSASFSTSPA